MDLLINKEAILGRGAFSVVYKGLYGTKCVAVKSVPLARIDEAKVKSEEQNLLKLSHTNITRLMFVEECELFKYYAYEFCHLSLEQCLAAKSIDPKHHASLPKHTDVWNDLAAGLDYLHGRGIAHGNVKPGNVLILQADRPVVKLTGFGLSINRDASSEWLASDALVWLQEGWSTNEIRANSWTVAKRPTAMESDFFATSCLLFYFLTSGIHPIEAVRHSLKRQRGSTHLPTHYSRRAKCRSVRKIIRDMLFIDSEQQTKLKKCCSPVLASKILLHLCNFYTREVLLESLPKLVEYGADLSHKDVDGNDSLILLCRRNGEEDFSEVIRLLLGYGIDLNTTNNDGYNALLTACQYGGNRADSVDVLEALLVSGIDVNCRNNSGGNALTIACEHWSHENLPAVINALVRTDIDVNNVDKWGQSALYHLCANGLFRGDFEAILVMLLNRGLSINTVKDDGKNALFPLCYYCNGEAAKRVRLLIHNGIDVNCSDKDGRNVLFILCEFCGNKENAYEIIQVLLASGMDLKLRNNLDANALLLACNKWPNEKLYDLVQIMLEHGVEVNCRDRWGQNALHHLATNEHVNRNFTDVYRLLTQSGIDVNNRKYDGQSPLFQLCQNIGPYTCSYIRELLKHGIDINCQDGQERNALLSLCENCSKQNFEEVFRGLLSNGISANAQYPDGKNALIFLSCWYNRDSLLELVQLLLHQGIDIQHKDRQGRNALITLCQNYSKVNLVEIIHILTRYGIDVYCQNPIDGKNAALILRQRGLNIPNLEVVRWLLPHGREFHQRCSNREEILDMIQFYSSKNIVDCIQKYGYSAKNAIGAWHFRSLL